MTFPRGESSSWETQRKQSFLPGELPAIAREGHKQPQPRGKGDKGQGRAAGGDTESSPRPQPAARGQRRCRDEAQGWRQSRSRDGFAFPVTPTQQGDIWGRVCSHHGCCNLLPALDTGPHWSEPAVGAGRSISSWQCPGNVWIDTHRAGQGGRSKGHFVVRGWGRRPGGTRSSKGHNGDSDSEGGDSPESPPLPARHRPPPIHSRALPTALPEPGEPCSSSQRAPEELSPQLSSGQGQGTTEEMGSSIPRPGKSL